LNLDETEQRDLWNVAEEVFRTKDKDKRVALDPKLMAAGTRDAAKRLDKATDMLFPSIQ
jgi:hypothetical protein